MCNDYYVFIRKDFYNDLINQNFLKIYENKALVFKITLDPKSINRNIYDFLPLLGETPVKAQSEKEVLYKILQNFYISYISSLHLPKDVYNFLSKIDMFYINNNNLIRKYFKNFLNKNYPLVAMKLKQEILRENNVKGYFEIANNLRNAKYKLNPLIEKLLTTNRNFEKEFLEKTTRKICPKKISLHISKVLAINHPDYQNCSYFDLIDRLKRFDNVFKEFITKPQNYFTGINLFTVPQSKSVIYKKIDIDNKESFLALESEGFHRIFFVNLLKYLVSLNYFTVSSNIDVYNFKYTKLRNINEKINYLQKKYPDLDIVCYNEEEKTLTFVYSFKNLFERAEVTLNELIYNNIKEIDKKFFDKSLTNQLFLKAKNMIKR